MNTSSAVCSQQSTKTERETSYAAACRCRQVEKQEWTQIRFLIPKVSESKLWVPPAGKWLRIRAESCWLFLQKRSALQTARSSRASQQWLCSSAPPRPPHTTLCKVILLKLNIFKLCNTLCMDFICTASSCAKNSLHAWCEQKNNYFHQTLEREIWIRQTWTLRLS